MVKDLTVRYNKINYILPKSHYIGWGLTVLSLVLYLIEAQGRFWIFNITKELWQMTFFLGVLIVTISYILYQIKNSMELSEHKIKK